LLLQGGFNQEVKAASDFGGFCTVSQGITQIAVIAGPDSALCPLTIESESDDLNPDLAQRIHC
jgi:hypothetical protein